MKLIQLLNEQKTKLSDKDIANLISKQLKVLNINLSVDEKTISRYRAQDKKDIVLLKRTSIKPSSLGMIGCIFDYIEFGVKCDVRDDIADMTFLSIIVNAELAINDPDGRYYNRISIRWSYNTNSKNWRIL